MKGIIVTYIKWFDASNQVGEEWGTMRPNQFQKEGIMHSAGILAEEDKKTVSLALEAHDGHFRHVIHIHKVNILARRDVRIGESLTK